MKNAVAKAGAVPLFEELDCTISQGSQDITFIQLLRLDAHKVRVRICSDSYQFQCWARAEIWSPSELKWNEVATRPYGAMQTPHCLYAKRDGSNKENFRADAEYLLSQLANILL